MIEVLGDRAVRFARPAGVSARAIVRAVRAWPGVIDAVVARDDVAAYFAGVPAMDDAWIAALASLDEDREPAREIAIATVYDGPDIDDVARALGVTAREVVERHRGAVFVVEMMGFAPGFAYMTGVDWQLPRRSTPRT